MLKIETGTSSLLVTGDIERRGEVAVLTQAIAADVIVVPHHGKNHVYRRLSKST